MSAIDQPWATPWRRARDRVLDDYGRHVGATLDQLPTPALIVDRDLVQRNIATMTAAMVGGHAALRPHVKVQKSPDLALLQVESGAVGVTVATVWEAAAMTAAGIGDVLVANQVVGGYKIRALAALAAHGSITVVVDDERNIHEISRAVVDVGAEVHVLIDLDVGMGRCGARSLNQALALAEMVAASPGLKLSGVQAYEGHCMLESNQSTRIAMANAAMDYASDVSAHIKAQFPSAVTLSGGGTGTYLITGRHPGVTELQAGSYVFMDAFHGNLVPGFQVSLTVLTTVMARHGDTVILDEGRESIGIDFVSPPIVGYDYVARYYAEEHALFDVDGRMTAGLGEQVRLMSGYAPTTVNLHDVFFVVCGEEVVDVWPIFPRGPSDHGFLNSLLGR